MHVLAPVSCVCHGLISRMARPTVLRPESQLFHLSAFLGPLETWRLRGLSTELAFFIHPGRLTPFKDAWSRLPRDYSLWDCRLPLAEVLRGANPHAVGTERRNVLHMVGVQLLLDIETALAPNVVKQTAVTWAADYGMDDVLGLILSSTSVLQAGEIVSSALNLSESNGWDPLCRAAWNGRDGCIRRLLAARANPEGAGASRYSPLMSAARWGHAAAVESLLEARCEPGRRNVYGESALTLATSQGHRAVGALLASNDVSTGGGEVVSSTRRTLGQGWAVLGWGTEYAGSA